MKEMIGGCCVCSDESGWDENPLVYCDGDGCNVAVHQACYGIVSVPSGPWFCRKCESQERTARVRCELCPSRGGALKRTDTNGWAHVVCALYIPEVRFGDVSTMEPILVSIVPPDRFNKVCCLCEIHGRPSRSGVGACMSCNKPGCRQCFHVTCAQAGGLLCEEQMHSMNNVTYCGYCPHHYAKMKRGHSVKPVPAFRPLSVSSSAGDTADITPDSSPQKTHPPTLLTNTASNIAGGMTGNDDRRLKRSRSSRASTPVSVKSEPVSQPCALQLTVPPPAAATANGNGNGTCLPPSTSAPASVARVDGVTRRDSRPSTPIALRAQNESADGYGVLKVKIEKSDLPLFNGGGGHVTGSSPGHTAVTTDDTLPSALDAVKSASIAAAAVAAAPVSASSSSIAALSSCASIVTSQNVVVTTTSTPTDSAIKTTTTTSPASIAPSDTASSGAPVAYTDPAIVGGTHLSDTKLTTSSSLASTTTTTTAVVSVAAGGCDVITDTAAESPAVSGCNSSSAPASAVVGVVSAAASSGEVPLDGSSITADSSSAAAAAAVSSVGVGVSAEPVKVKRPRAGSGAQQEPRKRKPPGRPRKRASPWQGDEGSEERPVNSNNAQVNGLPSPSLGSYTMLGNRLNTSSAMAQRLGDSLAAEIAEQSAEGLHEPQLPSAGATAATPLVTPPIRPPTQPRTATSLPQTLSELLERQWEQGSQFLMEQAQHFDISALLSCLYQLRRENDQLEEHVSSLTQQRDHLLAVQARLSVSLSDTTPARCPIPPPQPPSSSSSSSLSAVAAAAPAPTPPAAVGALGPAVNSAASSRYSRAAPRLLENGETPSAVIHQQQHQQQQHQQQSRMPLTAVRDRSVLLTGRPVSSSSLHSPLSHPHHHHHQMTLSSSAATGSGALPLLVTSSPSASSPAAVGAANNNNNSSLHSSAVGSTALSHLQLHPMAHSQHQPHHHSQHPHQHQHQRLMVAAHEHRLGELRSAGGGAAVSVSAGTDPALAQVRYPSVAHYQMVSPPCSTAPGSGHHVLHLSSAARYRSEKR